MLETFENGLVALLGTVNGVRSARRYLGELEKPEAAAIADGDLPLVLVDYVEDRDTDTGLEAKWNLYLVHVAYGKHQDLRAKTSHDLLAVRENIRRALKKRSIAASGPIAASSMKKLFDAAGSKGYLSVYAQTLTVALYDNEPLPADQNLE